MVNLLKTSQLMNLEQEVYGIDGPSLHEESTLQHPEVPIDMDEQWDELMGRALDRKKVTEGRLKELSKFTERKVYTHVPRKMAMDDMNGKSQRRGWCGFEGRGGLVPACDTGVRQRRPSRGPLCWDATTLRGEVVGKQDGKQVEAKHDADGAGRLVRLPLRCHQADLVHWAA